MFGDFCITRPCTDLFGVAASAPLLNSNSSILPLHPLINTGWELEICRRQRTDKHSSQPNFCTIKKRDKKRFQRKMASKIKLRTTDVSQENGISQTSKLIIPLTFPQTTAVGCCSPPPCLLSRLVFFCGREGDAFGKVPISFFVFDSSKSRRLCGFCGVKKKLSRTRDLYVEKHTRPFLLWRVLFSSKYPLHWMFMFVIKWFFCPFYVSIRQVWAITDLSSINSHKNTLRRTRISDSEQQK